MKQDNNIKTFTEKEKKHISAANYLTSFALLFNGIMILIINIFDRFGSLYLYSYIAALGLFAITVLSYLVLFIISLRKIKTNLLRYTTTAVLLALILAVYGYFSAGYIVDAFGGRKIVNTAEYSVYRNETLVFYDGSKKIVLELPKDIASQLCDKSLESKISLSENYLIIHSSSIKVEYYPNSEIFLSVDIGD